MNRSGQISSQSNFVRITAVWLSVLCLLFSAFPLSATEQIRSDLVFCPLQKKWVQRDPLPRPVVQDPLSEICSSPKKKRAFLADLSRVIGIFSNGNVGSFQEVYFKHLKDKKNTFASLISTHHVPGNKFTRSSNDRRVGNGSVKQWSHSYSVLSSIISLDDGVLDTPVFVSYRQRPVAGISSISRNINPRSPPSV